MADGRVPDASKASGQQETTTTAAEVVARAEPRVTPGAPIVVHGAISVSAHRTETLLISPYISPTDLEAYHNLNPELAARLVDHNLASITRAAEEEARENEHRRQLEKQDQKAEVADRAQGRRIESRGQWWAGVVALAGFVLCGYALYQKQETAAIWLGCTMIVALVGAFIAGRVLSKGGSPSESPSPTASNSPGPPQLPPSG